MEVKVVGSLLAISIWCRWWWYVDNVNGSCWMCVWWKSHVVVANFCLKCVWLNFEWGFFF